jgi:serine/threonine protein phosphatase PrpC
MTNRYQFYLSSNVGKVRKNNEDFYGEKKLPNGQVFVVCDGMGGHSGGEIASQKAVECIIEYCTKSRGENPIQMIHEAIKFANSQVHGYASMNPQYRGMGTTCVVVYIDELGKLFYGHVGDSRLYQFNHQGLVCITKDHSFVQYLVDTGEIQEHEMESHPAKNQILRALGIDELVKPEVCAEPIIPQSDDTFLICTDGLNGMIGNEIISKVLKMGIKRTSLPDLTANLIRHALEAGGKDNVTVALITYTGSSGDKTVLINAANGNQNQTNLKNIFTKNKLMWALGLLLILLLSIWVIKEDDIKNTPPSKDTKLLITDTSVTEEQPKDTIPLEPIIDSSTNKVYKSQKKEQKESKNNTKTEVKKDLKQMDEESDAKRVEKKEYEPKETDISKEQKQKKDKELIEKEGSEEKELEIVK